MNYERSTLPIGIENYYFDEFHISWDVQDEDCERPAFPEHVSLNAEIHRVHREKGRDLWAVSLEASAYDSDEEMAYADSPLLNFEACLIGLFTSPVPKNKKDVPQLHATVANMAAEVLVGALRERLAAATGTSPYGTYFLPVENLSIKPSEIEMNRIPLDAVHAPAKPEKAKAPAAKKSNLKILDD